MADSFEILVDRNLCQPVIAVKVNPVEGEPFALTLDIGTAKDIGLSLMSAAMTPVCPDTLLN